MSKFYRRFNSSVTNVKLITVLHQLDAAAGNADIIYIGNVNLTERSIDTVITYYPVLQAAINDTFDTDTPLLGN